MKTCPVAIDFVRMTIHSSWQLIDSISAAASQQPTDMLL